MHWPQIIVAGVMGFNLTTAWLFNGQPMRKVFDFPAKLVVSAITVGVLHAGGFF